VNTKKKWPVQLPSTHFEQIPIAAIKVAYTPDNMLDKKTGPPLELAKPPRIVAKRGQP
jgi:hypothetical protein